MKLPARVFVTLSAFMLACAVDVFLARLWTVLCVESCATPSTFVLIAYNVLMPIVVTASVAWTTGRPAALRRARPFVIAFLVITVLLSVLAVLSRGHAHGG